MTYQALKDTIIKQENGVMNEKQFRHFVFRFFLTVLTLTCTIVLATNAFLHNIWVNLAVLVLMTFVFLGLLDWGAEDAKVLAKLNTLSKFLWIVFIGLFVGVYILLKLLYFI